MPDQLLPPELVEFLENHIDSITQLEALLLLRSTPRQAWDLPGIAKRLYVDESQVLRELEHLIARGLVERDDNRYVFEPKSEDLSRSVALLSDFYRAYLIPITNIIHAKPGRIRQFADAFRLKKE